MFIYHFLKKLFRNNINKKRNLGIKIKYIDITLYLTSLHINEIVYLALEIG